MARTRRGIGSAENFGTLQASFGQVAVPLGIQTKQNFGIPILQKKLQDVHPNAIASAYASGTPTMVPGLRVISPSGITTQQGVGPSTTLTKAALNPTSLVLNLYYRGNYPGGLVNADGQSWNGTASSGGGSSGATGTDLRHRGAVVRGPAENGFRPADIPDIAGAGFEGISEVDSLNFGGLGIALGAWTANSMGGSGVGWHAWALVRPDRVDRGNIWSDTRTQSYNIDQGFGGWGLVLWQGRIYVSMPTHFAPAPDGSGLNAIGNTIVSDAITANAWSLVTFGWTPNADSLGFANALYIRVNNNPAQAVSCGRNAIEVNVDETMLVGNQGASLQSQYDGRIMELAFENAPNNQYGFYTGSRHTQLREYVFARYGILV
jgi:hypothetical protein